MMVEYIGGHVLQQLKIRNCSGLTAQFYSSCPDLSPEFQYYHIPTTHLTLAPAVYISRNRTHCLNSLSWLVPLSMLFIHWKNIYCHSSQKLKIHLHLLLLPHWLQPISNQILSDFPHSYLSIFTTVILL